MIHRVLAFLLLLHSAVVLAQVKEKAIPWSYDFQDYAVAEIFHGQPATPKLVSPAHRRYRSAILRAAAKGPNFAGRFTIAEWGCGAGCVSFAVIDAASGKVFPSPFKILSLPIVEGRKDRQYQGPVYQLKSRLFIADGCPEEDKCGTYYYEWTGRQFSLLQFEPLLVAIK